MPISVKLRVVGKEISVCVCIYRFIKVYKFPKPPKKPKKTKDKEIKEENKKQEPENKGKKKKSFVDDVQDELKDLGVGGFLKEYSEDIKNIFKNVLRFIKMIKLKVLLLDLTVATGDACDTALEYGKICSAAYPALSLICEKTSVGVKRVDINADFNKTEYDVKLSIDAGIRVISILFVGVYFLKIYRSVKNKLKKKGADEK